MPKVTKCLIVGGEDHKSGQAEDFEQRFQRLEDWARARLPKAGDILFHWSGQVMEPVIVLASSAEIRPMKIMFTL